MALATDDVLPTPKSCAVFLRDIQRVLKICRVAFACGLCLIVDKLGKTP